MYHALTDVLPQLAASKVLIVTDSEYVYKGVLGGAHKWRRHGWRGSDGPVADASLWKRVLALLECVRCELQWVHVPSHIGIFGNEQANDLAEQGRRANTLCPLHATELIPSLVVVLDSPEPVARQPFQFSTANPLESVQCGFDFSKARASLMSGVRRKLEFEAKRSSVDQGPAALLSVTTDSTHMSLDGPQVPCSADVPSSVEEMQQTATAMCLGEPATPEKAGVPVYTVDTPVAEDFDLQSNGDTESVCSMKSVIYLSSDMEC